MLTVPVPIARQRHRYSHAVTEQDWQLDESCGELNIRTGVDGPAARMGHRLTIAMQSWRATVRWSGGEPVAAQLIVEVDSLEVVGGEGGVKGLSGPEKGIARSNALKSLDAKRFGQISFQTDDDGGGGIEKISTGYRLTGTLDIHGTSQQRAIDLAVEDNGDSWRLSTEADVQQTEFGVKPYSLLMGSLKVADTVRVCFSATVTKDGQPG